MTWLYLATGILFIAIVYEQAPKMGGLLLIVIVLGTLISLQKKGIV